MKHEPQRWKTEYKCDGCVVVEDVLDQESLTLLREGIETITADPDGVLPHLKRHCHLEADWARSNPQYNPHRPESLGKVLRNIMELPLFDSRFAKLIFYEPVLVVLETLFESREFHFHNYKCIIKAPKVSSEFPWHRDLPYLEHSTPNLITAMLCLDDMTPDNGATVVIPGSHRIPHEQVKTEDVEIHPSDLPEGRHVTLCCPAGSAVFFHASIVHGGPPNTTNRPRRNVIGIWAGPDTYPVTAARYAYQGLYPHSDDPVRQHQVRMTFAGCFGRSRNSIIDFGQTGDPTTTHQPA